MSRDLLDIIINNYCTLDEYSITASADFYSIYIMFCTITRRRPVSRIALGKKLSQKGFKRTRIGHKGNRGFEGLRINY